MSIKIIITKTWMKIKIILMLLIITKNNKENQSKQNKY